jgi:hypothetical protein
MASIGFLLTLFWSGKIRGGPLSVPGLVQRGAQWELHQYPKLMAEKGAVPVQIPGYQIRYLPAYVPAGRAIPGPQLGLHFQNNDSTATQSN